MSFRISPQLRHELNIIVPGVAKEEACKPEVTSVLHRLIHREYLRQLREGVIRPKTPAKPKKTRTNPPASS